jgi:hypothetical protein
MKKFAILALAALTCLALATTAFAQAEQYDVGIFGNSAGTFTTLQVGQFSPFQAYVIAFGLDGLVKGFEVYVNVPPTITVTGSVLAGPAPINLGTRANEFIVGTGGCIEGSPQINLVQLNCGLFLPAPVPTDIVLALEGTIPSSFGGPPGYVQCDNTLVSFAPATNGEPNYPNGALVINPTFEGPIAVEESSFGAVKSQF